ncbi:MAG TPA: hypothetical protein VEX62_05085 [Candidatus Limnocylindrales bacterium]|nr:hypothetical protein [Candidatus Limnocylindrales bacterium]
MPSSSASEIPSASETPGATQTPNPAASPAPTNPPPLGEVIFSDDFSGAAHYLSAGDELPFGGSSYVDGVFRMFSYQREDNLNYASGATIDECTGRSCTSPDTSHMDLAEAVIDVDATFTEGNPDGSYGIACSFRAGGSQASFVSLTVSADGKRHAVARYETRSDFNFGAVPLDSLLGGADRADPHPAVATEVGATNHLRAECATDSFRLHVNGQLVAEGVLDEPPRNESADVGIALIAGSATSGEFHVDFDNLVVTELIDMPDIEPQTGAFFFDSFLEPSTVWYTGSQEAAEWSFVPGAYRATFVEDLGGASALSFAMRPPPDISLELDVTFAEGELLGMAGLLCRTYDRGGYGFDILPQGAFWIYRYEEGDLEPTPLIEFTDHGAIMAGAGLTNRLRFDCIGDTLTAYANDVELARVTDSTIDAPGYTFSAVGYGAMTVDFNNFSASYGER